MRSILAARFKMVNFGRERRMERVQLAHQKSTEALIPTLHALFFPWVVSTPAPYSSTFQDLPRPLINGVIGSVEQVELNWMGNMDTFKLYAGIAVKLESDGHKAPPFCVSDRFRFEDLWTGFYVDSSLFYVDSMLIVIDHAELACTENSVSIVRLHCVLSLPVVDFLQALVQAFRESNDGPAAPLCSCDGWNTPRLGGVRHRHTVFVNVHF